MAKDKNKDGPDLDRIGLFKEMSYLEGPVPVTGAAFNQAAGKGKQMLSGGSKVPDGTQAGYFESFRRGFEGEGSVDIVRLNRTHRLELAKKNLAGVFRPSSPGKKPCGLGSNYGTFCEGKTKLEHFSAQQMGAAKGPPPKKNFYTNPAKKGTGYGYPDVTIGKTPPYFLEGEYENLKDAEPAPVERKPRNFQPYRAGRFQQEFFDPNPYATEQPPPEDEEEEEEEEDDEDEEKRPFIPSSGTKTDGGMKAGCINAYPEHMSGPHPRENPERRGVKKYLNKQDKMFRPVPGPKPYPIKSVITKNVQRKVTPRNFTTIKGVVYCKK